MVRYYEHERILKICSTSVYLLYSLLHYSALKSTKRFTEEYWRNNNSQESYKEPLFYTIDDTRLKSFPGKEMLQSKHFSIATVPCT
jgi:hypothetical protein